MRNLIGNNSDKNSLSGLIRPEENFTYRSNVSDLNTFRYVKQSSTIGSGLYLTGIAFKPDGKIMYLCDLAGDSVYQYTLSTPWDITNPTYTNKSLSIISKSGNVSGVKLNPDGTKLYIIDSNNRGIFEYDLKTSWDVSTGTFAVNRLAVSTSEGNNQGISISSDGTKIYSTGYLNDYVIQHNLNVAYDISQGYSSTVNFSVNAQDGSPYGVFFKPDGTKFYICGGSNRRIYQYSLSTPWSISTASYENKSFLVSNQDASPREVNFSSDGTKMYIVGATNVTLYQYTLSTAWDVSTASYSNKFLGVNAQDNNPSGMAFNTDGTILYVGGYGNDKIYQYSLSVAWDISTATYSKSFSIVNDEATITGLIFDPTGTIVYIIGDSATDYFNSYKLEVAWDITTANNGTFSAANQDLTPRDLCFNSNGTKMYVLGEGNDRVYQYSLTYPYKIFSAVYDSKSFLISSQDTVAEGIILNSANNRMYIVGSNTKIVYEYSLSTPGDISTASYTGKSINISLLDTGPSAIDISKDDSKLFVMGRVNSKVLQINSSVFS